MIMINQLRRPGVLSAFRSLLEKDMTGPWQKIRPHAAMLGRSGVGARAAREDADADAEADLRRGFAEDLEAAVAVEAAYSEEGGAREGPEGIADDGLSP